MSQAGDLPVSPPPPTYPPPALSLLFVIATSVIGGVLWTAAVLQVFFVVPRFEKLFADFALRVPLFSEQIIRHGYWIVPACLLASALAVVSIRRRWAWLFALIVLPVLVCLVVFLSYFLPYQSLVNGLGGQNPLGF